MGCYGNYQDLYKMKTTLSMNYFVQANLLRLTLYREMLARLDIKFASCSDEKAIFYSC